MGTPALKSWRGILKASSGWFFSPQLSAWQKKCVAVLRARVPRESGMIWILSSGTQSVDRVKAIGLREEAVLAAAKAANRFLNSTGRDRWLLAIPDYHIGGLSIFARAHLSGAKVAVFDGKWSAERFTETVDKKKITLTSLVPTQVYDLVKARLKSPAGLRAIVVGGGALDEDHYATARALGWPVLPSYGLTECSSQIATASLDSLNAREYPRFEVLPHAAIELREQRIFLRATSLCRWIATASADGEFTLEDPVRDGWLPTQDLGELNANGLRVLGRRDDVIKVLGVLISIPEVEHEFALRAPDRDFCICAAEDPRAGRVLWLVTDSPKSLLEWRKMLEAYNAQAPGPRRIQSLAWIPKIPRTDLGKIKRAELSSIL